MCCWQAGRTVHYGSDLSYPRFDINPAYKSILPRKITPDMPHVYPPPHACDRGLPLLRGLVQYNLMRCLADAHGCHSAWRQSPLTAAVNSGSSLATESCLSVSVQPLEGGWGSLGTWIPGLSTQHYYLVAWSVNPVGRIRHSPCHPVECCSSIRL